MALLPTLFQTPLPAQLDFADLDLPRLEVLSLERVTFVLDSGETRRGARPMRTCSSRIGELGVPAVHAAWTATPATLLCMLTQLPPRATPPTLPACSLRGALLCRLIVLSLFFLFSPFPKEEKKEKRGERREKKRKKRKIPSELLIHRVQAPFWASLRALLRFRQHPDLCRFPSTPAACEAPFWASLRTLQADSATIGGLWVFDMEDSYLGRWAAAHHEGTRLAGALARCAGLMPPCLLVRLPRLATMQHSVAARMQCVSSNSTCPCDCRLRHVVVTNMNSAAALE